MLCFALHWLCVKTSERLSEGVCVPRHCLVGHSHVPREDFSKALQEVHCSLVGTSSTLETHKESPHLSGLTCHVMCTIDDKWWPSSSADRFLLLWKVQIENNMLLNYLGSPYLSVLANSSQVRPSFCLLKGQSGNTHKQRRHRFNISSFVFLTPIKSGGRVWASFWLALTTLPHCQVLQAV